MNDTQFAQNQPDEPLPGDIYVELAKQALGHAPSEIRTELFDSDAKLLNEAREALDAVATAAERCLRDRDEESEHNKSELPVRSRSDAEAATVQGRNFRPIAVVVSLSLIGAISLAAWQTHRAATISTLRKQDQALFIREQLLVEMRDAFDLSADYRPVYSGNVSAEILEIAINGSTLSSLVERGSDLDKSIDDRRQRAVALARSRLELCLRADADNVVALLNTVSLSLSDKAFSEAEDALRRAIAIEGDTPRVRNAKAAIHMARAHFAIDAVESTQEVKQAQGNLGKPPNYDSSIRASAL